MCDDKLDVGLVNAGYERYYQKMIPKDILSLGSVGEECMFLICSRFSRIRSLKQIPGKRINIDSKRSATNRYFSAILQLKGIKEVDLDIRENTTYQALDDLLSNKIDMVVYLGSPYDEHLQKIILNSNIEIVSLEEAPAIAMSISDFSVVQIPKSGLNLKFDIPETPIQTLSLNLELLVQKKLNHAVVFSILRIVSEQFNKRPLFGHETSFPQKKISGQNLHPVSKDYFNSNVIPIYGYLPKSICSIIQNFSSEMLSVIPLLLVIYKLYMGASQFNAKFNIGYFHRKIENVKVNFDKEKVTDTIAIEQLLLIQEKIQKMSCPTIFYNDVASLKNQLHSTLEEVKSSARKNDVYQKIDQQL